MCGRYALSLGSNQVRSQVERQLEAPIGAWEDEPDYNPNRGYNIPPRSRNPVILRGGGGVGDVYDDKDTATDEGNDKVKVKRESKKAQELGMLHMECMLWGLVPHWMKRQPDHAGALKTINARDDTIVEGGSMWKSIRGRRRCIVVAEGFYEWLKKGNDRVPHHVKRKDGQLMCFAGLWDTVTYEGETKPLRTYTIITTNSNKQLNFLHDRMPVILDNPKDMATWLDTSSTEWTSDLASLLKPFEGELECYIVPKEVGKVGNQSADFLKPIAERKGNIASLFAKQAAGNKSPRKETGKDQTMEEDKEKESSKPASSSSTTKRSVADKKDSPGTCTAASASKGKKKAEPDAEIEVGKEEQADLPINPDDNEKIKPASQVKSSKNSTAATGDKKHKKPIPIDDKPGKAEEPIVLDESDEDGEEKAEVKRKKRKSKEATTGSRKAKVAKVEPEHEADEAGNEKLTNFFEIKDADE